MALFSEETIHEYASPRSQREPQSARKRFGGREQSERTLLYDGRGAGSFGKSWHRRQESRRSAKRESNCANSKAVAGRFETSLMIWKSADEVPFCNGMKLPEHITLAFLLAQFGVQQAYGWPGTALVIAAGVLPDLDGLGIVFGWRFYQRHHRILGHGLPVTLGGPALLALAGVGLFGAGILLPVGLVPGGAVQPSSDRCAFLPLAGAALLWPISSRGWDVGLLGWNDLVPTLFLYGASAVALVWPAAGPVAAIVGIGGLTAYLLWRTFRRADVNGWSGWLAGRWASRASGLALADWRFHFLMNTVAGRSASSQFHMRHRNLASRAGLVGMNPNNNSSQYGDGRCDSSTWWPWTGAGPDGIL